VTDLDRLLQQIDDEASAEGPEGLRDIEALRARLDLAVQLIARRRQLGLTQAQLAAASGIAQAVISRIEQGSANPTVKTLNALAHALDASLTLTARAS
jgi:HTH-type transcriptional regulator/antitoxin HipB